MKIVNNLNHWLFYVILISISPVLIDIYLKMDRLNLESFQNCYFDGISKGELVLISIVLLGSNIGELLKEETHYPILRNSLIGLSVLMIFIEIFSFTKIDAFSVEKIKEISMVSFVSMIILTLSVHLFPKK
ncbi:hypothetical protein [Flagellimonas crocea]|uniref:hypothetical protein n=1 Tax=Flagellimonas crocea TaxID=3067311 RepID=UPI00296E6A57|nr:hypothetical protein [Muricauda sp. DH64]